jgi:WASH complex subunit 7
MLANLDDPGRDDNEIFFDKLRAFVVTHDTSVTQQVRALNADRVAPDHWDAQTDVMTVDLSYEAEAESIAAVLGNATLHNALFHRTMLVLASMKVEMRALVDEMHSTLLPPLALYGDPDPEDGDVSNEDGVLGLGHLIPHLMDIWNWHDRVKTVVKLSVQQFSALYDDAHASSKFAPYQTVELGSLWATFFELLGAVTCVEEVINQHELLAASVNRYMRVMENVKRHPDRYDNADPLVVEEFGRLVFKIETDLMQRRMLMSIATMKFDHKSTAVQGKVSANDALFRKFCAQFEAYSHRDNMARRDGRQPLRVANACSAFVLLNHLFNLKFASDSATHQRLLTITYGLHTIVPVVPIVGFVAFRTAAWLSKRLPNLVTQISKDPQRDIISSVQAECKRIGATFEADVRRLKLEVAVWQAQMQSSFSHDRDKTKALLGTWTELILRGVAIAYRLRSLVNVTVTACETARVSLTLGAVSAIHVAMDLLVTIRSTYHMKTRMVASLFPILLDHHAFIISTALYDIYKRLTEELQKGGGGLRAIQAESLTDQQCAIGQALALLSRPQNRQTIVCLELALHVAFHRDLGVMGQILGPRVVEELFATFATIRAIADHQRALREATDCDFFFWHRETLLPLFVGAIYKQPMSAGRLRHLGMYLHDAVPLILTAKHVKNPQDIVEKFEAYVHKVLEVELLHPLSVAVEEDLRNNTHNAVRNEPYKGARSYDKIVPYSRLTQQPRFRLFGKWFSIGEHVENYLEKVFYDLTAITPSLVRVYDDMRTQAKSRYGLTLLESNLPESSADESLDVLNITKNIHTFVVSFTYNLNEQLFVQRPTVTDNKHLHTVGINHIANCIRTHGTGIMNTTVNFVYKSLLKKLSVVSQFLYDDHIRSKLIKDIRYFNEAKHSLNGRLPVKRAEKFVAEVRKLGVFEDNQSYLDRLREVVSQIGNALGYMRLVRSGGLRCIAEAAAFIPHLDQVPFFEKVCNPNAVKEGEDPPAEELDFAPQVSEGTLDAIKNVDRAIENLTKRLSDGSDYLLMLLRAIKHKLADPAKYGHLRHFYMIVPALCMSYVEMMIHQKERLMKKNKEGLFTDDGFALGCVFLLALFSKNAADFDSLHWFESVVHHYQEKRTQTKADLSERIEQQRKDGDTLASQTIQLTLSMVEASLAEYSGLQQCFSCCRVFFQAKKREAEEAKDENAEAEE